jgi:hypothetical protein
LRKLTNELDVVSTEDGSLRPASTALRLKYPGLKERICDETAKSVATSTST